MADRLRDLIIGSQPHIDYTDGTRCGYPNEWCLNSATHLHGWACSHTCPCRR